jgi:WD40 repeat protein
MPHLFRLLLPVLLAAGAVVQAAPVPKRVKVPISPANAERLTALMDIDADVFGVTRGPALGELTLVRWEKPVEVVDDATLRPLRTVLKGKPIHFAASPTGDRYASCENNSVVTLRPAAGGKAVEFDAQNTQPHLTFSPDGKWLATGGYGTRARLWDTGGKLVREFDAGREGGLTPAFSPDGKTLAVGNRKDVTHLYDAATGKLLHTLAKKSSHELAFSPDGRTLAVGYANGEIALWDVAKGTSLRAAKSGGEEVYSVDWNPTGGVLVSSGREGRVTLWAPETLTPLARLESAQWTIRARFSADGCRLITSGGLADCTQNEGRKVTVWAVRTGGDK